MQEENKILTLEKNRGKDVATVAFCLGFSPLIIIPFGVIFSKICFLIKAQKILIINNDNFFLYTFCSLSVVFYFFGTFLLFIALFSLRYRSKGAFYLLIVYSIFSFWIAPFGAIIGPVLIWLCTFNYKEFFIFNEASLTTSFAAKESFAFYVKNSPTIKIIYKIIFSYLFLPLFFMEAGLKISNILKIPISEGGGEPPYYFLGLDLQGMLCAWGVGGFWTSFFCIPSGVIFLAVGTCLFFIIYLFKRKFYS